MKCPYRSSPRLKPSTTYMAGPVPVWLAVFPSPPPPLIGMQAVPDSAFTSSPWTAAKVFAFRQKASLFGHNAPNPNLFVNPSSATTPANGLIGGRGPFYWINFQINPPPPRPPHP